ncbi:hypothetical protein JL722_11346 [Aureococcus anophagefferens]|nr:hypothetical protein JL722_11346 [Aureococcus anophagefferens]
MKPCRRSALRNPPNIAIPETGRPPPSRDESGSAVAKKNAARALRDLVNINDEFKAMIREAGGIPPPRAKQRRAKGSAMEMLYKAHNSEEGKAAIREAGGIPVLVAVAVREAGGIPPLRAWSSSGKPMAPAREAATRALLAPRNATREARWLEGGGR